MKRRPSIKRADAIDDDSSNDEVLALRAMLVIDRDSLDDEMLKQPVLYDQVTQAHIEAVSERDMLKEQLAEVDAALAKQTRLTWEAAGKKFNETMIGDEVQASAEHQEAYRAHAAAIKRAAVLGGLVSSFEQRSKMLDYLTKLYTAGYFSHTSATSNRNEFDAAKAAVNKEAMRRLRKAT